LLRTRVVREALHGELRRRSVEFQLVGGSAAGAGWGKQCRVWIARCMCGRGEAERRRKSAKEQSW
jgi:hypothetical protein